MKQGATVTIVTRHFATVRTIDGSTIQAKLLSETREACVGDSVELETSAGDTVVKSINPRKNILKRCYRDKEKKLAANLNKLFIITAPPPLSNTTFIDRVLAAAWVEGIESVLIFNKVDLTNASEMKGLIDVYKNIGLRCISASMKSGTNVGEFISEVEAPGTSIIALAGLSGVGKSTTLNRLIPEAARTTQAVSEKSGQGKQTTSQSVAYTHFKNNEVIYVIDLPGIQSFGVSHLSIDQARAAFEEINKVATSCSFRNCQHEDEPNCAVRAALNTGAIAESRFNSFKDIIKEIKEFESFD